MNTALLAELQRPDTLKDSEKTLKLLAQVVFIVILYIYIFFIYYIPTC